AISCTIKENIAGGGLVLTLGGNQSRGGGVFNAGTLGMTNCLVARNSATGPYAGAVLGGGVFNQGILAIDSSTVGFNSALGGAPSGAGLGNTRGGTMAIVRTTISSNVAFAAPFELSGIPPVPRPILARGGGIANEFGVVNVESSTISGNAVGGSAPSGTRTDFAGGGVYNLGGGTVTLNHATVTANIASGGSEADGGAVFNSIGEVKFHDTIIAGNASAHDLVTGSFGASQSGGFNLVGSTNGPVATGPNDRFNVTTSELGIGPLQDNGGPTFTHALACGSPAINAGDNIDAPLTDQRGFSRIM